MHFYVSFFYLACDKKRANGPEKNLFWKNVLFRGNWRAANIL